MWRGWRARVLWLQSNVCRAGLQAIKRDNKGCWSPFDSPYLVSRPVAWLANGGGFFSDKIGPQHTFLSLVYGIYIYIYWSTYCCLLAKVLSEFHGYTEPVTIWRHTVNCLLCASKSIMLSVLTRDDWMEYTVMRLYSQAVYFANFANLRSLAKLILRKNYFTAMWLICFT